MSDTLLRLTAALADRYRIERELGHGGMATVYLATDLKHGRKVAIKVLKPAAAEAMGAERFVQEIRTIANLQHPHVLGLIDSGEIERTAYYVMPYLDGESLHARLRREGQLPIPDAIRIATQMAGALAAAHKQGIIHRDIKPDNILLTSDGDAFLADFGIALAMSKVDHRRLTGSGLSLGTPQYMSPEQAAGDRELDARSDIYALGAVTYEMLAGEPAVTGPSAQAIIAKVMTTMPTPLRVVRATVPVAVDAAVTRALAKDPVDRFASARDYAAALTGEGVTSSGPVPLPGAREGLRRWVVPALLGVVAVLAFLAWRLGGRDAAPRFERIAVLPLDNGTSDPAQTYFADGMTREVIGVLTEAGVRVLGHRATLPYRGTTRSPAQVAKELGVDAIVTGTVLRAGDQVEIAAELTDPGTGDNLWSRTFTRAASDVITLQHEIASEIAHGIRARLTADQQRRLGAARQVDPRAYGLYLLGVEAGNVRTAAGITAATGYLTRSLAIDSTFAPAWSALAIANAYAMIYQTAQRDTTRRAIERAARQAIALDPKLGDPHMALGAALVHNDWKFGEAAEQFRLGRERTLTSAGNGLAGWILWETGQFGPAGDAIGPQVDAEPTTAQWRSDLSWLLWSSRDTARARASALTATRVDSTFYEGWDILALIEGDFHDFDGAARAIARARRLAGGDYWVRQLNEGHIAKRKGDVAAIRRLLGEMDKEPWRLSQRASLHHLLGEDDAAFRLLNQAVDERDMDLLQVLFAYPQMFDLKSDPRFTPLLQRLGLTGSPNL